MNDDQLKNEVSQANFNIYKIIYKGSAASGRQSH